MEIHIEQDITGLCHQVAPGDMFHITVGDAFYPQEWDISVNMTKTGIATLKIDGFDFDQLRSFWMKHHRLSELERRANDLAAEMPSQI